MGCASMIKGASESPNYKFSGHETFPFRYTWLPKGINHLEETPDLFSREDGFAILGVGKNMANSIRHWCTSLGLIEKDGRRLVWKATERGSLLFSEDGWDPFLEDYGTLWLLHWLLVSRREQASTWTLAFTTFNRQQFTKKELLDWLVYQANLADTKVTVETIKRDVEVFTRTYISSRESLSKFPEDSFDSPLAELGLIEKISAETFQFIKGEKETLPNLIFGYSLNEFWDLYFPDQKTITFERVMYAEGSPGSAFKLSENALSERISNLPEWFGIRIDETAGMRVLLRADKTPAAIDILEKYFLEGRKG